jgi:hypothetical protein
MQVLERETLGRNESELGGSGDLGRRAPSAGPSAGRIEQEHLWWDPKDSELSMSRVKPGETLVEARSGYDVQIYRMTCV